MMQEDIENFLSVWTITSHYIQEKSKQEAAHAFVNYMLKFYDQSELQAIVGEDDYLDEAIQELNADVEEELDTFEEIEKDW